MGPLRAQNRLLCRRGDAFEAIAHFNPILVIAGREQNQNPAGLLLRSYTPLRRQIVGKLVDRLAFERRDRNDGDLSFGFLIHLGAKGCQFFLCPRTEDSREIIYVSLRFKILYLFRQ